MTAIEEKFGEAVQEFAQANPDFTGTNLYRLITSQLNKRKAPHAQPASKPAAPATGLDPRKEATAKMLLRRKRIAEARSAK
jgi:hypothetical protein